MDYEQSHCAAPEGFRHQPYNIDAEQALLGAVLVNNDALKAVDRIVNQSDFYEPVHREIYGLMRQMITDGRLADSITLRSAFETHPSLRELDGHRYLANMARAAESVLNAPDYARVIRDLSYRRVIIALSVNATNAAYDTRHDSKDWSQIAADLRNGLDEISAGVVDDRLLTVRQGLHTLASKVDNSIRPIQTGIVSFDDNFGGGLRKGCVYGFEGRMKRFKTGILASIFGGVWKSGVRAGFITLEMGPVDIIQREVAGFAGMGYLSLENPEYREQSLRTIFAYENKYEKVIDLGVFAHVPGVNADGLMTLATRMVEEKGCEVVVIDYWQRIRGRAHGDSKSEFLESISARVADFASMAGVAIVMASQLNRQDESLGSDGLARDCSWCGTINKVDIPTNNPAHPDAELWIDVTENRYGPAGSIGTEDKPAFRIARGPVLEEIRR